MLWRCRTDAAGLATRRADGAEAWGAGEDAAVPPERLADYLRGLDELMGRHGLSGASYGHFGEGCMHMRIDFDLLSRSGLAVYERSSRKPRISLSRLAARCPASTATAGPAPNCSAGCTARTGCVCSLR